LKKRDGFVASNIPLLEKEGNVAQNVRFRTSPNDEAFKANIVQYVLSEVRKTE
jgi:hypothetical protein